MTKCALRRADLVTGDSKNIIDECITLDASPERSHVIIKGVESSIFYPRDDCQDFLKDLGLDGRMVVISTRHFRLI